MLLLKYYQKNNFKVNLFDFNLYLIYHILVKILEFYFLHFLF